MNGIMRLLIQYIFLNAFLLIILIFRMSRICQLKKTPCTYININLILQDRIHQRITTVIIMRIEIIIIMVPTHCKLSL